jgi:hypothetical protein
MDKVILTDEQLQKRLKYWKKRLRLRDWDIDAHIYRLSQLDDHNHQGECEWVEQSKVARIKILDPADFSRTIMIQDMEECLVHELLHLHFAPMDEDKYYMPIEQAIEAIAKGLVEADRH